MMLKKLKKLEYIFITHKNINFLSLKFIFTLSFEIINKTIIKKGTSIPICFPKNMDGNEI